MCVKFAGVSVFNGADYFYFVGVRGIEGVIVVQMMPLADIEKERDRRRRLNNSKSLFSPRKNNKNTRSKLSPSMRNDFSKFVAVDRHHPVPLRCYYPPPTSHEMLLFLF